MSASSSPSVPAPRTASRASSSFDSPWPNHSSMELRGGLAADHSRSRT
ncbi:hypothetical protein O1M54_23080 [Streptomyces diastatochromogenes]|nr:hypothetical protein [Streptomyces diastatochromogenes]